MRIDLHIHSTASDGAWTPSAVVEGAARGRLDVIALADHDTVEGVEEATARGRELDVQVIPAVELSSTWNGRELHVLGYFVDPSHPDLEAHRVRARDLRESRMVQMIDRLADQGIEVGMDAVVAEAGGATATLSRPHLARVLVEAGHASSVPDAFRSLIGDGHPAFVPTGLQSPAEAVDLVRRAGGLALWAHPPLDLVDTVLDDLVREGLSGLEVYRPFSPARVSRRLERVSEERGLLASGGSDWHTPDSGNALGDFAVGADEVGRLLDAGGI